MVRNIYASGSWLINDQSSTPHIIILPRLSHSRFYATDKLYPLGIIIIAYNTISIQVPAAEAGGTYIFFGDTSEQPIETSKISYSTHVQNLGWQSYVSD